MDHALNRDLTLEITAAHILLSPGKCVVNMVYNSK